MLFLNPPKHLHNWRKNLASLPTNFTDLASQEIDKVIEAEIHPISGQQLFLRDVKALLEELLTYTANNPCIMLAMLDARFTMEESGMNLSKYRT